MVRWRSGGEEARYIQTICSELRVYVVPVYSGSARCICRSVAESVIHLPLSPPQKKTLRICSNPMTQHGWGRVPTRGYTLLLTTTRLRSFWVYFVARNWRRAFCQSVSQSCDPITADFDAFSTVHFWSILLGMQLLTIPKSLPLSAFFSTAANPAT